MKKQVNQSHYLFSQYMHPRRWQSMWHQLNEVIILNINSVLEIGPGSGLFKHLASHFNIDVKSVDIDAESNPDYVASVTDLPFERNSFDCVCAFQVLEHLPYSQSIKAFREMTRVAEKFIVISLPDAKEIYTYSIHIPKIGQRVFQIRRPRFRPLKHKFDGQHYWEINKRGFSLKKIVTDFTIKEVKMIRTYNVIGNTYHRFFVFEKL